MIKINLLGDTLAQASGKKPDKSEPMQVYAETEGPAKPSFPIAAVVLFLLLAGAGGVYYMMLKNQVDEATQKHDRLQAEKKDLEKYIQLEKTLQAKSAALQKKKEVMMALKANQQLPVHLMEELANCIPDDVWFQEINQKGLNISIKGQSASFEAIDQFRNRLSEKTQWFKNVNYPSANRKGRTVDFTISCDLKNSA